MKTYRNIKATIVTATIAAIKHMYELHDKSEFKLVNATRLKRPTEKLWAEHDLLGRAIVRAVEWKSQSSFRPWYTICNAHRISLAYANLGCNQ